MKFIKRYNIERNFPRGVYLSPLGDIPSLDIVCDQEYGHDLFVPIPVEREVQPTIAVSAGTLVQTGDLLAEGIAQVKSPCAGIVQDICSCTIQKYGECKAICIKPSAGYCPGLFTSPGELSLLPDQAQPQEVLECIRKAGIFCANGRLLYEVLKQYLKMSVSLVVANAVAPEPIMNTPGAILSAYPEQVYAGLAIIRNILGGKRAILAYPHKMEPDFQSAENWQVELVPVSEKYPQYHPQAIAQTLVRQRRVTRAQSGKIAFFDIQTLALVERAVMAGCAVTERVVTVAGDVVERPGHFLVPIGLAVSDLLAMAGVEQYSCVVAGRSLTGVAVDPTRTVVGPFCENYTVLQSVSECEPGRCIRCGRCIELCPAYLDPARIIDLIETGKYRQAAECGLYECYECGLCGYCCSAGLNILENIRMARRALDESR